MDQYESKHEEIPCGQLMHLALEVNYQIIEYRNNNKLENDPQQKLKSFGLPLICAL